jgi:hypothetical protein
MQLFGLVRSITFSSSSLRYVYRISHNRTSIALWIAVIPEELIIELDTKFQPTCLLYRSTGMSCVEVVSVCM